MNNDSPAKAWYERLELILAILAIMSLVFSAGLNWSRITTLERRLDESMQRQDRIEQGMANLSIVVTDNRSDVRVLLEKISTIQRDTTMMRERFDKAFR